MTQSDYELAHDANTSAETLAELAERSSNIGVLTLIALNPHTPPETLAQLAQHSSNRYFVTDVARNRNTPPETLAQLAQHPSYKGIQLQIAGNPNTPPETLAQLARQSSDKSVIISITANVNTPPETLAQLARHPSQQDILDLIALNPHTPPETLAHLAAQTPKTSVLAVIAGNPNTPPDVLTHLMEQSSDMGVLRQIAQNPSTPAHLLPSLWQHPRVVAVRAEDPNPRDFAGYDASDEVALYSLEVSIAHHPNLPQMPEALLRQIALDWKFGNLVLFDLNASPQVLEALARSGQQDGLRIALHRNTPGSALEVLACRVRIAKLDAIQAHPNSTPLAEEIIAYRRGQGDASQAALDLLATYG